VGDELGLNYLAKRHLIVESGHLQGVWVCHWVDVSVVKEYHLGREYQGVLALT
jgi:hypothetical protein